MRSEKIFFNLVDLNFTNGEDSGLMSDRKSCIFTNAESLGYFGDILVFAKAQLKEVKRGTSIVYGWVVQETVKNPANRNDGYVICTRA
ncbi:MAG: hypothetical protein IKE91_07460 [Clostridia bacterium]|nr:hypothetical protein [Clostridia bacterium]